MTKRINQNKNNLIMVQKKRAQIKIQETAFMLLALIMLFALIFIFYSRFEIAKLYAEANQKNAENAIKMLNMLSVMPEFAAVDGGIDYDKILSLRNVSGYEQLWKGIRKISVVRIYPQNESKTILIYDSKKDVDFTSYSTYTALCVTRYKNWNEWQDCDLARLIVDVEGVKPKRR